MHSVIDKTHSDAWYQTHLGHTGNEYFGDGLWVVMRSGMACRCTGGNGTAEPVPGQKEWRIRTGEISVLMEVRGLVSLLHLL